MAEIKNIMNTELTQKQKRIKAEADRFKTEAQQRAEVINKRMALLMAKAEKTHKGKEPSLFPEADSHAFTAQEIRVQNMRTVDLSQKSSVVPTLLTNARFFTPAFQGRRAFFPEWRPVPVWGFENVECFNRIYQLNQWDLTIKLGLLHFAQKRDDLISCFSGREFLKFIKRPITGRYRNLINEGIERLQSAQVAVRLKNEFDGKEKVYRMTGPLVGPMVEEETNKLYAVSLYKEIHDLLGIATWSFMDMEQRAELGKHEFALEWHAFLSSHKGPTFWIKKTDLMTIWGTNYSDMENFLRMYRRTVLKPLNKIGFITRVEEKKTAIGITYQRRK
jgi:hypothetical protein